MFGGIHLLLMSVCLVVAASAVTFGLYGFALAVSGTFLMLLGDAIVTVLKDQK